MHACFSSPTRKEIKSGSELGQRIKSLNDSGKLVDDATIVEMARARIAEEGPHGGFILDGFPRTVPQAQMLDKLIKLDGVIDLVLRQDILVLKACSRRVCRACGEGYNLANIQNGDMVMPPLLPKKEGICDKVGLFDFANMSSHVDHDYIFDLLRRPRLLFWFLLSFSFSALFA